MADSGNPSQQVDPGSIGNDVKREAQSSLEEKLLGTISDSIMGTLSESIGRLNKTMQNVSSQFKSHQTSSIAVADPSQEAKLCSRHKENYSWICEFDKRQLCSGCMVDHNAPPHSVKTLAEYLQQSVPSHAEVEKLVNLHGQDLQEKSVIFKGILAKVQQEKMKRIDRKTEELNKFTKPSLEQLTHQLGGITSSIPEADKLKKRLEKLDQDALAQLDPATVSEFIHIYTTLCIQHQVCSSFVSTLNVELLFETEGNEAKVIDDLKGVIDGKNTEIQQLRQENVVQGKKAKEMKSVLAGKETEIQRFRISQKRCKIGACLLSLVVILCFAFFSSFFSHKIRMARQDLTAKEIEFLELANQTDEEIRKLKLESRLLEASRAEDQACLRNFTATITSLRERIELDKASLKNLTTECTKSVIAKQHEIEALRKRLQLDDDWVKDLTSSEAALRQSVAEKAFQNELLRKRIEIGEAVQQESIDRKDELIQQQADRILRLLADRESEILNRKILRAKVRDWKELAKTQEVIIHLLSAEVGHLHADVRTLKERMILDEAIAMKVIKFLADNCYIEAPTFENVTASRRNDKEFSQIIKDAEFGALTEGIRQDDVFLDNWAIVYQPEGLQDDDLTEAIQFDEAPMRTSTVSNDKPKEKVIDKESESEFDGIQHDESSTGLNDAPQTTTFGNAERFSETFSYSGLVLSICLNVNLVFMATYALSVVVF